MRVSSGTMLIGFRMGASVSCPSASESFRSIIMGDDGWELEFVPKTIFTAAEADEGVSGTSVALPSEPIVGADRCMCASG